MLAACFGLCTLAAAPEAFGSLFVWCILFKYWKTLCRWYLLLLYYCSGLFILHFLYKSIASTSDALFHGWQWHRDPEHPSSSLHQPPIFPRPAPAAECTDGTEAPELFLGAQRLEFAIVPLLPRIAVVCLVGALAVPDPPFESHDLFCRQHLHFRGYGGARDCHRWFHVRKKVRCL